MNTPSICPHMPVVVGCNPKNITQSRLWDVIWRACILTPRLPPSNQASDGRNVKLHPAATKRLMPARTIVWTTSP